MVKNHSPPLEQTIGFNEAEAVADALASQLAEASPEELAQVVEGLNEILG